MWGRLARTRRTSFHGLEGALPRELQESHARAFHRQSIRRFMAARTATHVHGEGASAVRPRTHAAGPSSKACPAWRLRRAPLSLTKNAAGVKECSTAEEGRPRLIWRPLLAASTDRAPHIARAAARRPRQTSSPPAFKRAPSPIAFQIRNAQSLWFCFERPLPRCGHHSTVPHPAFITRRSVRRAGFNVDS